MDVPYLIRPARPTDVAGIADIERRCFSDPWSEKSVADAVSGRGVTVFVAEWPPAGGPELAGYVVASVAGGAGEILNLAVDLPHRHKGIAGGLLDDALAHLDRIGVTEVFLEVRESNTSALSLYAARAFRPVGMRRAYYRNPKEDALVLRRVPGRGA